MNDATRLKMDAQSKELKNDISVSLLDDLTQKAKARYAIKDYSYAAELYSRATELQAELNGEMSLKNADLLYMYGRCLYHVAVRNSDVLGSKVAGEKQENGEKKGKPKQTEGSSATDDSTNREQIINEERVAQVVVEKEGMKTAQEERISEGKPFFQFTGDENYVDSEEDDGEAEDNEAEAEQNMEEDDFSNAYEVLDLARILLHRKLQAMKEPSEQHEMDMDSEAVKRVKERLADTHDLQAEISLEGERFPNAIVDLKAALELKKELFPDYSSILAEAHFKLSLAFEFSSVTQEKDVNRETEMEKQAHVDEALREEAAVEMEAAISSCKLRITREEMALSSETVSGNLKQSKPTRESIDDVKEMVKDMEHRLVELRQPPVSINDPVRTGTMDGANPLSGILGSILGESPEAQKAKLEEASEGATDLTNLVKRKKPAQVETLMASGATVGKSGSKRKADTAEEIRESETVKKSRRTGEPHG